MSLLASTDLGFNITVVTLSVIAVQWGMKRNLETQSAIRRVTPPIQPDVESASIAAEPQVPKARTGCARFMPNRTQWLMLGQYALFGLIAYFLPRYGNTLIADLLLGAFELSYLSFLYQRAIECLFPVPTQLRYVTPKSPEAKMFALQEKLADNHSFFDKTAARMTLGVLCGAATLFGASQGYKVASILAPPAVILAIMPCFVGPSVSMRFHTYVLLVFQILPVVAFGGTALYRSIWPKSDVPPPTADKKNSVQPSAWLIDILMLVNGWLLTAAVPTGLLCLTNRFEHFSRAALPPSPAAPGATLIIERDRPFVANTKLSSPATIGLLAYAAGLALYIILIDAYAADKDTLDSVMGAGPVIIISATMLAVIGPVLYQGRWSEWWAYYEQWAKKDTLEQVAGQAEASSEKRG